MAAYSALTAFALTILPPGRASVLAFSTPIWVVPLAALWLGERAEPAALLGTGLGLVGVVAIAAPSVHIDGGAQVIAYTMLVVAAVSWAISIVVVRGHRFTSGALALAPWQTLVAACLLLPIAFAAEGAPRHVGVRGAVSLAFVGPVATAFAYWAVVETGRHFSARTLSMALLATPPVGILLSALTLGETVGPSLVAGAALIAAGIRLAVPLTKSNRKAAST
jgi:drug/metabolite transporter (DMT)-like permease